MRDADAQQDRDECVRVITAVIQQLTFDYVMKYEGRKFAEI